MISETSTGHPRKKDAVLVSIKQPQLLTRKFVFKRSSPKDGTKSFCCYAISGMIIILSPSVPVGGHVLQSFSSIFLWSVVLVSLATRRGR